MAERELKIGDRVRLSPQGMMTFGKARYKTGVVTSISLDGQYLQVRRGAAKYSEKWAVGFWEPADERTELSVFRQEKETR